MKGIVLECSVVAGERVTVVFITPHAAAHTRKQHVPSLSTSASAARPAATRAPCGAHQQGGPSWKFEAERVATVEGNDAPNSASDGESLDRA